MHFFFPPEEVSHRFTRRERAAMYHATSTDVNLCLRNSLLALENFNEFFVDDGASFIFFTRQTLREPGRQVEIF